MTVIKPNAIAGINSITVASGAALAIHKADGTLIQTLSGAAGVSTFTSISVGSAATSNSAAKSINIGLGASISQHTDNTLTFGTAGDPVAKFDASGQLLLGTGTARQKLHINASDSGAANMVFTNTTTGTAAADGFIVGLTGGEDAQLNMQESANIKFSTADTARATIEPAGNINITKNVKVAGVVTATSFEGSGANLTGISAGITTEAASISGITTYLNLSKDDHELVVTGNNTISVIGGAQGTSHTLRLQNSGIATVTLDSTYFKFASGGTPAFPTASGSISLVSFTVHKAGAVGVNTVLLTGASVSFS